MKFYKYKIQESNKEFIIYGENKIPEDISDIIFIKELKTPEEAPFIPIYEFNDFMVLFLPKTVRKRTRDKILADIHIHTWNDLKKAYLLVRISKTDFSKSERDFIVEKYSEIVNSL